MQIFLKIFIFLILFFVLHCNHNRVYFNDTHNPGEQKTIRLNYYLMGLVPKRRLTFQELCGNQGIYEVHAYTSKFDGLISCISLFMYTPRTVEITCNGDKLGFKLEEIENSENFYKIYSNKPEIKIAGIIPENGSKHYEK
ncbi:MAG: hypothetical protein H7A23_20630 [Leptospiraceae bacterium]|nr:hypothetical protein [Leptospiraceae bacterium]MCP5496967.1 hypothetical protein [Leptospiraceae bacterium]